MAQRGEDFGFTLEAGQSVGIAGKRLRRHLQRDLAVELGIGGLIQLAHATLTEESSDVIVSESGTD